MDEPSVPVTRYEYATIRLAAIVDVSGFLSNAEFHHCHIEGPAIVAQSPNGWLRLEGCELRMPGGSEAMFWPFAPGRSVAGGLVIAENVAFVDSIVENVGFALPAAQISNALAGIDESGNGRTL